MKSSEAAAHLLSLVPLEDSDTRGLADSLTAEQKLDFEFELTYLRLFTIDLAVSTVLGNSPVKQQVLESFYGMLGEALKNSKGDMLGELEDRLQIYQEAFNTPHHLGPPWMIGKAFSRLSGHNEFDAGVVARGSVQFAVLYKAVSDFINSHEIA